MWPLWREVQSPDRFYFEYFHDFPQELCYRIHLWPKLYNFSDWQDRGCSLLPLSSCGWHSCGMLSNVCWELFIDVSGQPMGPISRVMQSKAHEDGANWLSRYVGKHLLCVTSQKNEGLNFLLRNQTHIIIIQKYRGADKSLARPGRKHARKHVRDVPDFNNIETRAVINFFFSCKARCRRQFTPFWQKH